MNEYGYEIVPVALAEPALGLTEIQDRRYQMSQQGLSVRKIARLEGVSTQRVRVGLIRAEEILDGSR